jgi:hypothetical protein
MDLLLEGWLVVQREVLTVLVLAACLVWGLAVAAGTLKGLLPLKVDAADMAALASGAWIVSLMLITALGLALGMALQLHAFLPVAAALATFAAAWLAWSRLRSGRLVFGGSALVVLVLAAIVLLMIALRLAFIGHLVLPLYFDSPTHYGIIQKLVSNYDLPGSRTPLEQPFPGYYHLGYHVLLAAIVILARLDVAQAMLVLGQVVLAVVPLPIFFIVRRATGSVSAALLAVLLGAFGWYMPAHVVNWGKYPALFSLPVVFTAINVAFLAGGSAVARNTRRHLLLVAGFTAAAAFFIHTRSIIVLLIVWLAWALAGIWMRLRRTAKLSALGVSLILASALSLRIVADPLLAQVLDPYLSSGIWITLMVGLFTACALGAYPRLSLSVLMTAVLLLAALTLPGPLVTSGTLLDRPLVEMLLFAPLAMLGGLGFAGFAARLRQRHLRIVQGVAVILAGGVLLHAFTNYSFFPSTCCSLVGPDDLVALDWVERNLPPEAHIAVSAAPVRAASEPYPAMDAPADAGAWITPLVGRLTSRFWYAEDFSEASTFTRLCESHLSDVYVGNGSGSFGIDSLQAKPEWYRLDLHLPNVRIYHVIGCKLPE